MAQDGSEDWKRIADKLFASREEPSEAFVRDVMRRIEKADARVAPAGPRLVRVNPQWLAPVMGAAAMLVLTLLPAREAVSAETLLFAGEPDTAWMAAGSAVGLDEMLGYALEAAR